MIRNPHTRSSCHMTLWLMWLWNRKNDDFLAMIHYNDNTTCYVKMSVFCRKWNSNFFHASSFQNCFRYVFMKTTYFEITQAVTEFQIEVHRIQVTWKALCSCSRTWLILYPGFLDLVVKKRQKWPFSSRR